MSEKTMPSQQIYDGRILKLRVDTVRLPSGRMSKREIVEHDDSIAIVAIDGDDNVLLVKQFRKAVEKEVLEIPAGGIEPGEEPVAAVKRELCEETGFLPKRVERIGGFYSAPGYSSEFLHLFVASDLTPEKLQAEDTESIKVERVPVSQILELIRTGAISDAKSVAGLLMLLFLYLVKPVEN
ncbi:MAG: NUDIX hydrolase [Dehalococcoidales bacterium]